MRPLKFYMLSYCLVSLSISLLLLLLFSLFHTPTHTLRKTFFPPDCFPIFLAERFMVRGMLETGYYHVLFELISQTKWSRWRRRHSRAFCRCRCSTLSPPTCLRCLSPVLTLLQWLPGLPHRLVFHQRRAAVPFSPSNFAFSPHLTQSWMRSCVCPAENRRFTPQITSVVLQVYNNIQEFDFDTEIFRHFEVKMSVDTWEKDSSRIWFDFNDAS